MESDLRLFWQDQAIEHPALGLQDARRIGRESSGQGGRYYLYAAFCFVFCAVNLFQSEPGLLDRAGGLYWFACGLGMIYRGNRMGKAIGPRGIPSDVVFRSCLEAYRKETEARRYAPLAWTFVVLAAAMGALSLIPGAEGTLGAWLAAGPFAILLIVWVLMLLGWPRYFADLRGELGHVRSLEEE